MFTENAFAGLAADISPAIMQAYIWLMVLFVVLGTLFDIWHKRSAEYFFANWRRAELKGVKKLSRNEVGSLALETVVSEVLTSSEFCNQKRRMAHLLTMYGFVIYAVATVILVFCYTGAEAVTPPLWPLLWTLGALMVCAGGYWFWFFIRVDVLAEGQSPFRFMRADLFIVSLLASVTLGLIWAHLQNGNSPHAGLFLVLYLIATTVLFGSVPWSKFSHMFFKPAAALQKRVADANGTRNNLPPPADKPEVFGDARRQPNHY